MSAYKKHTLKNVDLFIQDFKKCTSFICHQTKYFLVPAHVKGQVGEVVGMSSLLHMNPQQHLEPIDGY